MARGTPEVNVGPIDLEPTAIADRDGLAAAITQVEEIRRAIVGPVAAGANKDLGNVGNEPRRASSMPTAPRIAPGDGGSAWEAR